VWVIHALYGYFDTCNTSIAAFRFEGPAPVLWACELSFQQQTSVGFFCFPQQWRKYFFVDFVIFFMVMFLSYENMKIKIYFKKMQKKT